MERREVLRVASKVRNEFETGQIPRDLVADLYYAYNPEVEVHEFMDKAIEIFPRLNCGLASVYLQHLVGGNVMQGSYDDEDHTFLYLGAAIVDITADQFGGPPIYVGRFRPPWAE